MLRFLPLMLLAGLLPAQTPPNQTLTPKPATNQEGQQTEEEAIAQFRTTVQQVTVPVLVYDASGNTVNGLKPDSSISSITTKSRTFRWTRLSSRFRW